MASIQKSPPGLHRRKKWRASKRFLVIEKLLPSMKMGRLTDSSPHMYDRASYRGRSLKLTCVSRQCKGASTSRDGSIATSRVQSRDESSGEYPNANCPSALATKCLLVVAMERDWVVQCVVAGGALGVSKELPYPKPGSCPLSLKRHLQPINIRHPIIKLQVRQSQPVQPSSSTAPY